MEKDKKDFFKNKTAVILAVVAFVLFILIVVLIAGKSGEGKGAVNAEDAGKKALPLVELENVSTGTITEYRKFGGTVTARDSVAVLPDTAGKVAELYVRSGDFVEKDQVLGKIDASRAGQNYNLSPVKAPISGTITAVNAVIGAQVSPAAPFAIVQTLDDLEISFSVIERYISAISEGKKAFVTFDAYEGKTFEAHISHVDPTLDVMTRTLTAKAKLDNDAVSVKAGMFARLNVITQIKNDVIVVPYSALTVSADETYCFVCSGDLVKKVNVEIGIREGDTVEITEGLHAGDKLVVKGQGMLSDGEQVRVLN